MQSTKNQQITSSQTKSYCSLDYEYGILGDEIIRNDLVLGAHSEGMKEKILQESDLTLDIAGHRGFKTACEMNRIR